MYCVKSKMVSYQAQYKRHTFVCNRVIGTFVLLRRPFTLEILLHVNVIISPNRPTPCIAWLRYHGLVWNYCVNPVWNPCRRVWENDEEKHWKLIIMTNFDWNWKWNEVVKYASFIRVLLIHLFTNICSIYSILFSTIRISFVTPMKKA
jgi:hypothetical protein